jgi:hypothetical protein
LNINNQWNSSPKGQSLLNLLRKSLKKQLLINQSLRNLKLKAAK